MPYYRLLKSVKDMSSTINAGTILCESCLKILTGSEAEWMVRDGKVEELSSEEVTDRESHLASLGRRIPPKQTDACAFCSAYS